MASWLAGLRRATLAATCPASLGLVRTGAGAVMLASPRTLPGALGVAAGVSGPTAWVVQMLGAREVALGAGVLTAHGPEGARGWALAGAACDVVDALVVGAAVRRGVVSRTWGSAVAASALAAGTAGLAHLAQRR